MAIENVSRLIKHVEDVAGISGLVVLDDNGDKVNGRTYISTLNDGEDIEEFRRAINSKSTISDAIRNIQNRTGLNNIEFRDNEGNKIHGNTLISNLR
ncbi:MAG: hypothetical protein PUI24_00650 [Spirochaetales bacterium]|nr:hypothetical protein [Spirochaetales bacterium]